MRRGHPGGVGVRLRRCVPCRRAPGRLRGSLPSGLSACPPPPSAHPPSGGWLRRCVLLLRGGRRHPVRLRRAGWTSPVCALGIGPYARLRSPGPPAPVCACWWCLRQAVLRSIHSPVVHTAGSTYGKPVVQTHSFSLLLMRAALLPHFRPLPLDIIEQLYYTMRCLVAFFFALVEGAPGLRFIRAYVQSATRPPL